MSENGFGRGFGFYGLVGFGGFVFFGLKLLRIIVRLMFEMLLIMVWCIF